MKIKSVMLVGVVVLLAACSTQTTGSTDKKGIDPEEVRGALMAMVKGSGNKWMGEELKEGEIVREGERYRIGRWTFSIQRMTFAFEQVNETVKPPVFFGVSGVLERELGGKVVARVTGGRQM